MRMRKRKEQAWTPPQGPVRAPVPEPPKLPDVERSFFDILLRGLDGGLHDAEKEIRHHAAPERLLQTNNRLRGTVSYARALLRLEELQRTPLPDDEPPTELSALLNMAIKNLRRSLLYAGTAARRADNEPSFVVRAPQSTALFLLEEMIACCLRCAPQGKNLYFSVRPIGAMVMLSLRTEGPALQQSPLIPLLPKEGALPPQGDEEDADPAEEDYGFAVCRVLAARLGWAFRWEADEAGVRMFLDIK